MDKKLSKTLRDARESVGLSQEAVARLVGVSSKSITRWEANGQLPHNPLVRSAYLAVLDLEEVA